MRTKMQALKAFFRRMSDLLREAALATALGVLETLQSERGRRALGVLALAALLAGAAAARPVRAVATGEVGLKINHWTGGTAIVRDGWTVVVPGLQELRLFPARDQVYRPAASARADGEAPFQSVEGLSIGVDVAVRYALDPARLAAAGDADVGHDLVEPVVDGVLHKTFARSTVREIFSTKRAELEKEIADELRPTLAPDGVLVRAVFLGSVDLPREYRAALESLLEEELSAEKMRYTLDLREKEVKEAALQADAEKVKREKAAEAASLEELIAARSRAEAMKHVLPLKRKEIEQKRLEAEAAKVARLKRAEGNAEARRI